LQAQMFTRLASFSRLIRFDKRGTGLSDPVSVKELPTLEERMDVRDEARREHEVDRPVTHDLVGDAVVAALRVSGFRLHTPPRETMPASF